MARESQGLQIALIISVMFNILFLVGTILFWKQYDNQRAKALAAVEEKSKADTAASSIQSENNEFKRLMGYAATDKLDGIQQGHNDDMETYAANYTGERTYRAVLEWQHTTIQEKNNSLEDARATRDTMEKTFEQEKQGLIQQRDAQQKAAEDKQQELVKEQAVYRQSMDDSRAETEKAQDTLAAAQQKFDTELAQLQDEITKIGQNLDAAIERNKELGAKVEEARTPVFEQPDGKIRWVDQRNQTVWINLGRADGLARQTSFSVYPADATDVTRADPKGKIEVTQIRLDHMAEARIIQDDLANPIMPGDLIHTLVWSPGEREHFALLDGMDIDDDGKSDLELVRNIIATGGGVVDCWIDDAGNRFGEFTVETRYLVEGAQPPDDAPKARFDARSKMYDDATKNSLRMMPLKELLNRMGYLHRTPVVRFGPGAPVEQWRPKPPEGGPKASSGTVSDLFERRRPPPSATGRRSAY